MPGILKDSYDEHFALIIGINNYEYLSKLEYAVNDAKAVKEKLIEKFQYKEENITILLDEQATHQNIMEAYYDLVNKTCNNDSVIIFFAGHGTTYPAIQKDKGFLVPCDGCEIKMNSLISWDTLIGESELIRAKHIFFIMDACYSGLSLLRSGVSKRFLKDMVRRQARQVLTAGKSDQTVKDSGANTNNSIFTGYLLDALDGEAKTEEGVICASSIMYYVYSKVANDPNSRQTPGYGNLLGEGDFIFNYDEIYSKESNKNKDNDVLIEINTENKEHTILEQDRIIDEIKQLLSDNRNYIKITDIVNKQLRAYSIKSKAYVENYNVNNDESFANAVQQYKEDVENLLKIVILLVYYGGELYLNLITKILLNVSPKKQSINLLYYPLFLIYYVAIIAGIESKNYKVLKEILELETNKLTNSYTEKNLLKNTCINMSEISYDYKIFFEINYKFPLSEYLYKELQPLIDDFLYVGDDYEEIFISAEMLISIYYAISNYEENDTEVLGPVGRYNYKLTYDNRQIEKLPIGKIINEIGLYKKVTNKEKFIKKYEAFLSKHYF